MRLRTRLALAFAAVAALPVLILSVPTRALLSQTLEDALEQRLDRASHAAQLSLDEASREADRAAQDLARAEPLEQLAQDTAQGLTEPVQVLPLGEKLMVSRGVDVLEVLDAQGRVLTSGHLPARAGDPDPAGLALALQPPGPQVMRVEIRAEGGIQPVLAMVSARPIESGGARLYVLAGRQLGPAFAQKVADLTGAEVEVTGPGLPAVHSATRLEAGPRREKGLAVGDKRGQLELRLSAAGLEQAESRLLQSVLLLALLALGGAAAIGVAVALRLTRPVDALAEGARALSRGELGYQVQATATGELGELIRAFNLMAGDLKTATERATLAERIAAWQEVARRLAHEIKNPLTPIRMSIETLQKAYAKKHAKLDEIFTESTRAVIEEVDRLRRIIDEFSKFARLPTPTLGKLDLIDLVGQVLSLYAGSKLEVTRELDDQARWVFGDRDQLTQVLVNLLTNAEQAMPQGGACAVRLRREGAEVVLEVHDSGPGIPEAARHRMFEPYFTTKASGTGLGLSIVQRIVSEHKGRIELGPGPGACFRVWLPVASAPSGVQPADGTESPGDAPKQ
jgi:nitrogen fixation/metabolism regulation signal transduction histidine kinase